MSRAAPVGESAGAAVGAGAYLYFAYGSNMSTARLTGRTPSARAIAVGRVRHHGRRWHKRGRDGSGKCDIVCTGPGSGEVVWGVLYRIAEAERGVLDRAEGLGVGYLQKVVPVVTAAGIRCAVTYQAKPSHIDPTLRPFAWYKAYVLAGAREHGLPADCVAELAQVAVRPARALRFAPPDRCCG